MGKASRLTDVIPWLGRGLDALRQNLWLFPALGVLGAGGLSVALTAIDQTLSIDATAWYLFRGGPEGARAVLGAVATAIMTCTGVGFSVTVLVLQLASEQFSPRVMPSFLGDRPTQISLSIFVSTFVYALLTLRSIRGASHGIDAFVPSLSVWFAVTLAIISVGTFVFFIDHVSQQIRAVNVLARLGDETRASIQEIYPDASNGDASPEPWAPEAEEPDQLVLHRGHSGVLVAVSHERLWRAVGDSEVTVELVPMLGDFVPEGGVLARVWGDASHLEPDAVRDAIAIGRERTFRQDPAFGFRSIVDVAVRALSPGVNDPTTAVQALDQLHDLLRNLMFRRFPSSAQTEPSGRARLVFRRPDYDAFVRLALDEIRHEGHASIQVVRRLRFLLDDLLGIAPPSCRDELRRQLQTLDVGLGDGVPLAARRELAREGSAQGHGPG